jgi:iron complex outermembrane recepter protein
MPGGFNFFANSGTVEDNRFEPQWSTNYELGLKGHFRQLMVSAALFRLDIRDIHVYRSEGAMYMTDNAKKAHSQGIELELNYRPLNSLELTAAVGLIDATYDDYDVGNGLKFDGKRIEQTPSHSISLGVGYYHPKGFYARIDARNRGVTYFYDDVNKDFARRDSYTIFNARIGFRLSSWDLFAFGTNLTDQEYITSFKSSSALTTLAAFGRPRRLGVGFRFRY